MNPLLQADIDPEIASQFGQSFGEELKDALFGATAFFEPVSFWNLIMRFAFNLLICWIIVHFFYYRKSGRRDYYFTYILFSISIFFLLFLLQSLDLGMGIALGLFAIFGMIRYRTESVPIREMTYLFVIIAISIVNGFSVASSFATILASNILFILVICVLEWIGFTQKSKQRAKLIRYEKIDLINADRYDDLVADLKQRTGLDIIKVQVGSIDFLKDTAWLKVIYNSDDPDSNDIEMLNKFKGK